MLSFHAVTLMISFCSLYIHIIFILSAFVLLLFSLVAILIVFYETYNYLSHVFSYCDYNTDHRVRLRRNFHLPFKELFFLFSASEVLMDMTAICALQACLTAVISTFSSMSETLPIKENIGFIFIIKID